MKQITMNWQVTIDLTDVPNAARFVAVDRNGSIWAYAGQPTRECEDGDWVLDDDDPRTDEVHVFPVSLSAVTNWKDLCFEIERPRAKALDLLGEAINSFDNVKVNKARRCVEAAIEALQAEGTP